MNTPIIIGSRGSDLALWQANHVKNKLKTLGFEAQIKIIKTQGDRIQDLSFDKLEGKGFFTKEIEQQLLSNEIDLAVHSHKDLETASPKGLMVAAVPERESPSELLILRRTSVDQSQKFGILKNATVGTSSARRKNQLLAFRPDIKLKDLRGNVPTRIAKLRQGNYDAIMLAKAGVTRLDLDLDDLHVIELNPAEFIPAPAQGALALQIREGDNLLADLLKQLSDVLSLETTQIERKVLNLFEGGCQLPLGVYAEKEGDQFRLWASHANSWEEMPKRICISGSKETLAQKAVDLLKKKSSPKRIFISRDLHKDHFIQRLCSHQGCTLTAVAQIEVEYTKSSFPQADWVFFSSANSAISYFEQADASGNRKYAAIGEATAEIVNKYRNCDFVGSGFPDEVGKSFSKRIGSAKVCFPVSSSSKKTVQNYLSQDQVIDVIAYRTKAAGKPIPESDYYLFTSPSNVDAFLNANEIPDRSKVVAIGPSTRSRLEELGFNPIQAKRPSLLAMVEETFNDPSET